MEQKRKKQQKLSPQAQKAFGPKVVDIFLGDEIGDAPAIVRLPRAVHLNIEKSEKNIGMQKTELESEEQVQKEKSADKATLLRSAIGAGIASDPERLTFNNELVFHFTGVADVPEPVDVATVKDELSRLLDEDEKREERFVRQASEPAVEKLSPRPILKTSPVAWKRTQNISQRVVASKQGSTESPMAKHPCSQETDALLKSIMQSDVSESYIPYVAPPVSWKSFRKERAPKKNIVKQAEKAVAEQPKEKKVASTPTRTNKKKLIESSRVAFAALLAGAAVGLIGAIGAAPNLVKTIGATAKDGAQHLTAGLKQIAGADVEAGRMELDQAEKIFGDAQKQLDDSTGLTIKLLAMLDPKARLSAGEKLLSAGKQLSALGGDAAQLTQLFREQKDKHYSLTELLEQSQPLVVKLAGELKKVDEEIKDINPAILPKETEGDLSRLQGSVHTLATVISGYVDSHEVLNFLLGAKQDRQYLFLFENNRELRPGGGFIGSFALANISKGEVKKVSVDSIYNPDGQLREYLIPPAPLKKITDRWFARDANWFADFRINARKVSSLFEKSGGPTVDGVIAITPSVLQQLLRVTGPIVMPDYQLTVTADNVIDETQRLVTFDYDKTENKPKAFIGDLMPIVLARVTKLPQDRWGDLLNVFGDSLKQKQIIVWLRDTDAQMRVEKLGWGGAIDETNGDYLMRVEANIGGHKTDELVAQTVKYDVSFAADGSAIATLVTTRHHQGSKEGRPDWNPDEDWYRKPNVVYERTLVPKGSVLLEASGFADVAKVPAPFVNNVDYQTFLQDADVTELEKNSTVAVGGTIVSEESGKTSFGNWIVTNPGETAVTVYKYRLPINIGKNNQLATPFNYQLLTQQQPGHQPLKFEASVNIPSNLQFVWAGPENGITYDGKQKATFTTIQKTDNVWGVVIDRYDS